MGPPPPSTGVIPVTCIQTNSLSQTHLIKIRRKGLGAGLAGAGLGRSGAPGLLWYGLTLRGAWRGQGQVEGRVDIHLPRTLGCLLIG